MQKFLRAAIVFATVAATGVAFGQDTTTTSTDLLGSLGVFAPILLIIWAILWASWGGFRWLIP